MRCRALSALPLVVGLLVHLHVREAAAQAPPARGAESTAVPASTRVPLAKHSAPFQAQGVVALESGTLIVWAADGRIRVNAPEGGWSPVSQLPMTYITSAVSEGERVLFGGSYFPEGGLEQAIALTVDAQGAVQARWHGGEGLFNSVTSSLGKRWAVALNELVELLPDGSVSPVGKVPSLSQLLVGPGGQRVLCTPADRTLAASAPAECSASGTSEWRVQGSWSLSPLVCGQWLVTSEGGALVVRSLSHGEELVRRTEPARAFACGPPGELLVGDKQVRALALPSLKKLWQKPCGRSHVRALASSMKVGACLNEKGVVSRLDGSGSLTK